MNKFHYIPTDKYVPVSHDNSYLFNHYEKVSNFLAFNLEKNYKNILGKPIQNNYVIDWFSPHEELRNIKELDNESADRILVKYWEFISVIERKVDEFSNSRDENKKNWAGLLGKVFNRHDNFLFSNGQEFSIVWGWKFDSNEIYKPSFLNRVTGPELTAPELSDQPKVESVSPDSELMDIIDEPDQSGGDEEIQPNHIDNKKEHRIEPSPKNVLKQPVGFVEFLKWFASNYWWLLWLLTFLILVVFCVKILN